MPDITCEKAVHAPLQALVKFEGCQAALQKGLPGAEAATPDAEMQSKLQGVSPPRLTWDTDAYDWKHEKHMYFAAIAYA